MRLPFSRSPNEPAATGDDAVQRARTRARRRLVGALVLLVAGVIGLPLLFDAQPRPLPADTPIVAPAREVPPAAQRSTPLPRPLPPAVGDSEASAAAAASVSDSVRSGGGTSPPATASTATAAAAQGAHAPPPLGRATPAAASAVPGTQVRPPSGPHVSVQSGAQASAPVGVQASPPASPPASPQASPQASASPPAAAGRFVVQAGAYTDAATLRDARARVERLGLRTYTQVIETDDGKRTRVRVGPFATRGEASGAAARLKAAGLPANILALP